MNDIIIGFDIRLNPNNGYLDYMGKEYREEFLLNPDVEWPSSVDTSIWPSVFIFPDELEYDRKEYEKGNRIIVNNANFWHSMYNHWQDFKKMEKFFTKSKEFKGRSVVRIATTVVLNDTLDDILKGGYWSSIAGSPLLGATIDKKWKFIGYDVADDGKFSGLSNCSYSEEEKAALIREWANRLNTYGLFSDLDDAIRFAEKSDKRVPGHAPFYVYGLYSINENELKQEN